MAKSLNEVRLIGNIASDPKLHSFDDGGKVCNFTLVTSEEWKDRQTGEDRESKEFHRCVARNHTADYVAKYLAKGKRIHVSGSNKTRKYQDSDGKDCWVTEIQVIEVINLSSGKSQSKSANEPGRSQNPSPSNHADYGNGSLAGQIAQ